MNGARRPTRSRPRGRSLAPSRGQQQGRRGEHAPWRGPRRHVDAAGSSVDPRHRPVQVLPGERPAL